MSFVKNYFSSKTASRKQASSKNSETTRPQNSISTLAKLISNPSALNPLKILPIRRNRVRPTPPTPFPSHLKPQVKHKLAVIDGKLQIGNITVIPTTTESPIVHIGDDMSFEELTQALSTIKKNRKKKLKLRVKTTTPEPERKKDDDNYEDYSDEQNNFEEKAAQEKVDNDDKNKANHVVQDPQDPDYDANDGLKGIFIDIESGEVTVMKPVAELTSFLPKKEDVPSAEEMVDLDDLLLDEDGDGVADKEVKRKSEIFSQIQTELKKNYDKMKKDHERVEAKKRRKEILASKGMDESVDVVSKYFDMVEDDDDNDEPKS